MNQVDGARGEGAQGKLAFGTASGFPTAHSASEQWCEMGVDEGKEIHVVAIIKV